AQRALSSRRARTPPSGRGRPTRRRRRRTRRRAAGRSGRPPGEDERVRRLIVVSMLGFLVAGVRPASAESPPPRRPPAAVGVASWYGDDFQGNPTASGERFDARAMTAAHPSLPLGARV